MSFAWPTPGCSTTSRVLQYTDGSSVNEITKWVNPSQLSHCGIDLTPGNGAYIYSPCEGTIAYIHTSCTQQGCGGSDGCGNYGNHVYIKSTTGWYFRLAHMQHGSITVKNGDTVKKGQRIGKCGSTGDSSGPHLHFEIRNGFDNSSKVGNPMAFDFSGKSSSTKSYMSSNYDAVKAASDLNTSNLATGSTVSTSTIANSLSGLSSNTSESADITSPSSATETSLDITTTGYIGISGKTGNHTSDLLSMAKTQKRGLEVLIENRKKQILKFPVLDGAKIELSRKDAAGKFTFTVTYDSKYKFQEGNPVSVRWNGHKMFHGYVFKKERKTEGQITVTAYDQLRYLMQKDTLYYYQKTYKELVKLIASKYGLRTGSLTDTKYQIENRFEKDTTLYDMLENASDLTLENTGELYILYDYWGKLRLKNISDMKVNILIDKDTAQSYKYTTTIDSNVYNKIKVCYDNSSTGVREVYELNNAKTQAWWGQLLYTEVLSSGSSSSSTTSDDDSTSTTTST